MASLAVLTADIISELGLPNQPKTRKAVERFAGEATVELLSQSQGRFRELKKSQTISVVPGTASYDLNEDFNTPRLVVILDSNGVITGDYNLVTVFDHIWMIENSVDRSEFAYVDNPSGGLFQKFVLSESPTTAVTLQLEYYRYPVAGDLGVIRNDAPIRHYIKSNFPNENHAWQADLTIYERMKAGFSDKAERLSTARVARPSKKSRRLHIIQGTAGKER